MSKQMQTAAARLIGFAGLLAGVFLVANLAGAAIDPDVDEQSAKHAEDGGASVTGDGGHAGLGEPPPGLAVAEGGLRLVPETTSFDPVADAPFRFRIVDADGQTVRDFEVEHERRMHLIVVRRDFERFQHVHPAQLEDGAWEARLDLAAPGTYRAFADFATGEASATLAADLFVAGGFEPARLPQPAPHADAGDGYEVTLDSPAPRAAMTTDVEFTVLRNGREVDAVERYLGADGHLVALREHDQAYLHTHPRGEPGGAGPITFGVEYPSAGRFRLFLQFKHGGEVRTAAFTQEVPDGAMDAPGAGEEGGHGE